MLSLREGLCVLAMQQLVMAGQAGPLQSLPSARCFLLLVPSNWVCASGSWQGRGLCVVFFMQQLTVAIQVYCKNEASEVCYVHVAVETVESKRHPCRHVRDRNADRMKFAVMMNHISVSQRFSSVNITFWIFSKAPHLDLKCLSCLWNLEEEFVYEVMG